MRLSASQSLLDAVEYPHEQARRPDCLGGFGDVVVVDLAMTGRI